MSKTGNLILYTSSDVFISNPNPSSGYLLVVCTFYSFYKDNAFIQVNFRGLIFIL